MGEVHSARHSVLPHRCCHGRRVDGSVCGRWKWTDRFPFASAPWSRYHLACPRGGQKRGRLGFVHIARRSVREYCVFRVILSPSLLLFPFRPLFVFIWSLVGFPLPSLIRFVHSLYVLRCNIIVSFHSIYHPHCPHPITHLRIRLSGDKVWIKWVDKVSLFDRNTSAPQPSMPSEHG